MLGSFCSSTFSRCPSILILAANAQHTPSTTYEINLMESDNFPVSFGYYHLTSAYAFSFRGEQQCRYVRLQRIILVMPSIGKLLMLTSFETRPLVLVYPIFKFFLFRRHLVLDASLPFDLYSAQWLRKDFDIIHIVLLVI
jgi:hypothetical protein